MDATTRLKLEELRKEAFKRFETDRRKATIGERESTLWITLEAPRQYPEVRVSLLTQILRGLRIYPLYDCLAMWLDPDAGLAHYAPELLLSIGTRLMPEPEFYGDYGEFESGETDPKQ